MKSGLRDDDRLLLICSRCHSENFFPRLPSIASQDTVHTYCVSCGEVTAHRTAGGGGGAAKSSAAAGTPAVVTDEQLWQAFEQRANQYNVKIADVLRTDVLGRQRILESMGFPTAERDRLVDIQERRRSSAEQGTATPTPQPVAPSKPDSEAGGDLHSTLATGHGLGTKNRSSPLSERTMLPGLSMEGDNLIARCSVYPHLPAEFWCAVCNVLVSSRCHVQGIHKDHPFITLRLAAESHVRDITSWNERCRAQINVVASVFNNLKHAETLIADAAAAETKVLEDAVEALIGDLLRWKEQLKKDIVAQIGSQQSAIVQAARQTESLLAMYTEVLGKTEPLMLNIPPVEGGDRSGEDWALRVLDLVSKLRHVNAEAVPMPKVLVPRVSCLATPATYMELIKAVPMPLGVRLPDIIDPGYFNFPNPSVSARLPFSLVVSDEAVAKGVMVYNGRTLTRSQDVVPSHHLVMGSQVFYSGAVSWEVHIDRMGSGSGRILAGVTVNGSDGEGVVWDGTRIVGPNEGESRILDDRYAWRPGTVLRFHLDLEGPGSYLHCFYDRDGVARIPLPANGHGWVPAFSVFGPQDQITVVPSSTAHLPMRLGNERRMVDPSVAAGDTVAQLERQEHILSSLQQQIAAVNNRVETQLYRPVYNNAPADVYPSPAPRSGAGVSFKSPLASQGEPQALERPYTSGRQQQPPSSPTPERLPSTTSLRGTSARDPLEAYSPELRRIIRYVESSDGITRPR